STHYEGMDLPDVFVDKPGANPHDADQTLDPVGFSPSARGFIPVPAGVQRTSGMYVAFTRHGKHRVTVVNGIPFALEAREAQEKHLLLRAVPQTIFHDIEIKPVDVTIGS